MEARNGRQETRAQQSNLRQRGSLPPSRCLMIMNPNPHNDRRAPQRGKEIQDIRIIIWNIRTAGNKHFLNEFKEHIRLHKPQIVALMETHISGDRMEEVAWTKYIGFEKSVHDNWTDNVAVVSTLRSLSAALNKWNMEVFRNLFRRKRKLWARIQGIQRQLSQRRNRYLLNLETSLKQELREVPPSILGDQVNMGDFPNHHPTSGMRSLPDRLEVGDQVSIWDRAPGNQ
ncbi:hypothetical protein Cgig2_002071 [Carnegiea gigantea]|uniref:Endonuclease/exonuclease/phosphatase domain-containing protein n=1 Tax=Carnegiea gigantea TaxID=171969 RepID=A0A9Q1JUL2_9CARY|nr:hypothetical protein Cgig2_002071 [Carnegiea gigantea]